MFFVFLKVFLLLLSVHYKCNNGVYFFFFQKLCCRWTGSSYRSLHSTSLQSITPKFCPLHSVSLMKSCKQNRKLTFCQVPLLVRLFCFSPFLFCFAFNLPSHPPPPSYHPPLLFTYPPTPLSHYPPPPQPPPPPWHYWLHPHPTPITTRYESYVTSNLYLWKRK